MFLKYYSYIFYILGIIIGFLFLFIFHYQIIFLSFVLIILGLYILLKGGDYLVEGSAGIAKNLKLSPIVIGLTIISFGTSAPEFFVNVLAALKGQTDLVISNIIGSNLANLLLVLGVIAIIAKSLPVKNNTLYKEIPFSLLAIFILLILSNDYLIDNINFKNLGYSFSNYLTRIDGIILLSFFIIFLYYVYSISKDGDIEGLDDIKYISNIKAFFFILMGMLGLYFGGELVVNNAKFIAESLGWSQILIGSTIVAIGTSLPELVASVVAALKRQIDMAVGNIIGSNIFNIFWIGGASAVVYPVGVDSSLNIDMFILFVSTLIIFISIYFTKNKQINFLIGILLLFIYFGYMFFTIYRG